MRRISVILGAPIDDVTMDEAVERIFELVDVGRATGRTHQVATVNVDFVVQGVGDPGLSDILQRTDLSIPDGMPLVWGSRLLGVPLRERVAGADLVPALAVRGARRGATMYLFGGAPGVAARAATLLESSAPGIKVFADAGPVVTAHGEMDQAALDPIIAARPDIVCVALGNPKQEYWIERHRHLLGAPVCIGIGGTLDLLVGEKRRAPQWMQRAGLEWVFRALQEPRRLVRRYAHDFAVFGPRLGRQLRIGRVPRGRRGTVELERSGGRSVVRLAGRPGLDDMRVLDVGAGAGDEALIIDIAGLDGPDNRSSGVLAALALEARRLGVGATLHGADASHLAKLSAMGLGDLFRR